MLSNIIGTLRYIHTSHVMVCPKTLSTLTSETPDSLRSDSFILDFFDNRKYLNDMLASLERLIKYLSCSVTGGQDHWCLGPSKR